jgi:cellulose biosynthesis protein BcsQ
MPPGRSLDELSGISDRVLNLLGSLTDRREGTDADTFGASPFTLSPETVLGLSKLMDYALFGEVFAFLAGIPHLQNVASLPGLEDFRSSILSVASRKGGVGKSTLTLAIALALLQKEQDARLCIVDLDITGPIWQYLLSPDGRTLDGHPIPYLNKLINIDQPDDDFWFGTPLPEAVLNCVARVPIPSADHDIGLLTFADLPRTNRYLVQAIANNRESFTEFFVAILKGLAKQYDFIVIDNTPGFDPHPLITLVIAGAVPLGLPIVVSTPSPPDMRGTFLELSDLRLLRFERPPLWIINKSGEEAEAFFSEERTIIDIAAMTRGYAEILPDAPLLKRVLHPTPPARIARPLPFDIELARPNIIDFSTPLSHDAVTTFIKSRLFRRFAVDLDRLLPAFSRTRGDKT